jgi:cytochrome c-type biogenesis protein CcmH/NrfG
MFVFAVLLVATSSSLVVSTSHAQVSSSDPELTQRRIARMERHLALGRAQNAAGHATLAQRHFEDALRENPSAPEPYLELGRTFLALERHADAVTILSAGRHRAPDDASLVAALAEALERNMRGHDALRLLREATQRHPSHVALLLRHGETAQRMGAWSEAADAFAGIVDLARRGATIPADVVESARQNLRALGIVLGDAHPRARRCDPVDGTADRRWERALAACGDPS